MADQTRSFSCLHHNGTRKVINISNSPRQKDKKSRQRFRDQFAITISIKLELYRADSFSFLLSPWAVERIFHALFIIKEEKNERP